MAPPMMHNAAARSRMHRGKSKPKNPKDRRRCRLLTWNNPPLRSPVRLPPPALRIIFKRLCVSVYLYLCMNVKRKNSETSRTGKSLERKRMISKTRIRDLSVCAQTPNKHIYTHTQIHARYLCS